MPYLDAALAFALTMLAVATLVTQIVRIGQNAARLRRNEMKRMLKEYFEKELKPVVDREMERLKSDAKAIVVAEAEKINIDLMHNGNSKMFTKEEIEKLTDLSTEELLEWLKRTEMGRKLVKELGDKANEIFNELGKRYEAIGDKFTKSFREHSRWWATGVALVVAFALNVDSIFLINTYIQNEGMRQAVIAQKDSLTEGYTTLQDKFEQDQKKTEITKEEFEQAFSDARSQLDIFTSAGFPVGYSYFPYVCIQAPEDPVCDVGANAWFFWVLGCILTGLLAGLGGPFWYDIVRSISNTVQSVRSAKKPEG